MSEVKQDRRFTPQEMSLIESTFKDQENLLILIRRFLLQDKLKKDELNYLTASATPEVIKVLKKTIGLVLDKGAVLNGTVDIYSGMDITGTLVDHAVLQIKVRKLAHQYLAQQIDSLEGNEVKEPIVFDNLLDGKKDEDLWINFATRNFLLGFIDTHVLRQLQVLANINESPEQAVERMKTQSMK